MLRMSVFPMVFGGCLIFFVLGFRNRSSWLSETVELRRQREVESYHKSKEFKKRLEEELRKRRESKLAEEKVKEVRLQLLHTKENACNMQMHVIGLTFVA